MTAPPQLPPASPAAIDVLARLLTTGPIPRVRIARETGLSQAAVTKAIAPLIDAGFVALDGTRDRPDAPGRPATPLRVVADAVVIIGVKVTADEVIGVATDFRATILDTEHRPLPWHTPGQVVRTVQAVTAALAGRLGTAAERLVGVGVS